MKKYYKLWGGLGLLFTFVLWNLGAYISMSCGGGYIDLGICPNYIYTWGAYSYISIIILLISLFLIYKIKKEQDIKIKNKLGIYILLLGIIGLGTYYVYSHDMRVLYNSEYKKHLDKEGKVTDIEKYIDYMEKYCTTDDYQKYRIGGNESNNMCKKRRELALDKAEYYIEVFEYANNNDLKELYKYNYKKASEFGLEEIVKNYNDKTFMYYLTLRVGVDIKNDSEIIKYIDKEIFDFYEKILLENSNFKKDKEYNPENYLYDTGIIIKQKLKNNKEINQKIF